MGSRGVPTPSVAPQTPPHGDRRLLALGTGKGKSSPAVWGSHSQGSPLNDRALPQGHPQAP